MAITTHTTTIGGILMPNRLPIGELKLVSHVGTLPLTCPPRVQPRVRPVTMAPVANDDERSNPEAMDDKPVDHTGDGRAQENEGDDQSERPVLAAQQGADEVRPADQGRHGEVDAAD